MGILQKRVEGLVQLGIFLSQFSDKNFQKKQNIPHNELFFDGFKHQLKLAQENNSWFTEENLVFACKSWSDALTIEQINKWIANQSFVDIETKRVAIVMAGNIPLVGFHDFISVLISGHSVLAKLSSNDKHLLPFLAKYLEYVCEDFKGKITFTDQKLENFDAVIATGSNNTARYFEYYFRGKPSIIRKNRNSVAVLTGDETKEDLEALSFDVFQYFGLGCRSVSKIFVPRGYDFNDFFGGMFVQQDIINNVKYANNYDYNKAVYLMSEFDILENGFLMIKEDQSYASPIATVFYEYYDTKESLQQRLANDSEKIQCIVGRDFTENEVSFGQTQHPNLWDYADGVNTLDFLSSL